MKLAMRISVLCLGFVILLGACETEELSVSYIDIPRFEVNARPGTGASTADITEVRVVLDSITIGIYPLPAVIPILATGPTNIRLEPVVRRSGLSQERLVYPMYQPWEQVVNLQLKQTQQIIPVIDYVPNVAFALLEDFETGARTFEYSLDTIRNNPLRASASAARTGLQGGLITLGPDAQIFEVASPPLRIDRNTQEVWIELDFRGEADLALTLLPVQDGTPATRLPRYLQGARSRTDFQKFYFDIVDEFTVELLSGDFRLGLLATIPDSVTSQRTISLDNIKVVYR